jgi:pyridoxamine 5'-phosphate oxidase
MDKLSDFHLLEDPIESFLAWYNEAKSKEQNPEAMTVSTANKKGIPSARILLYKGMQEEKFRLFTNYNSTKAKDLMENPVVSLTFYWHVCERQVRIQGLAHKMEQKDSKEYFHSRAKESQIASLISNQSAEISSREELESRFQKNAKSWKISRFPTLIIGEDFSLSPSRWSFSCIANIG